MSKPMSCQEVHEDIARVLDGTAPVDLHEHIADCDHCRDLRHEASEVIGWVEQAGADYVHPASFEDFLLTRLEAAASGALTGVGPVSEAGASEPAMPDAGGEPVVDSSVRLAAGRTVPTPAAGHTVLTPVADRYTLPAVV